MPEITDPNILSKFGSKPAPSAPAPQSDPIIKRSGPDPYQVSKDQISQSNEAARLRMAQEDQAMQREKFALDKQKAEAELGTSGAGKPTADQARISTLLSRIKGGFSDIQAVTAKDATAQEPGLIETIRGGLTPDGLLGVPVRGIAGENRRTVHDSQVDVLDALLTLGTGAAYNKEQLYGQMVSYFPQYNDAPNEIAVKNQRLKRLIEAAKVNAGPYWGEVEAAIAPYLSKLDAPTAPDRGGGSPVTREQSMAIWGVDLRDEKGNPLGPDGGPSFRPDGSPAGFASRVTQDMPAAQPEGQSAAEAFGAGVGDIVQGAGDVLGIVGNPLNATINAVTGSDLTTDLGRTLRDASGLPDSQNPTATAINRAGTGGLLTAGAAGLAARLPGAVGAASQVAATRPLAQAAGAATGGGASETARQNGAGPVGQIGAGLVGGLTGFAGANALGNTVARVAGGPNALLQAAQRQGVDMLPADVGGVATRRLTGAAVQAPVSAGPVVAASQRSTTQTGNALARTAANQGEVLTTDVAGEQVRKAGQEYIKNESSRIGRLYENAGAAAKGVKIKPNQALAEIDAQIASFTEIGDLGKPIVNDLETLRRSIEGGISVQGIRNARTIISEGTYDGKLRSGQQKAILKGVIDKISSDIELGLRNAGREGAARTFKRADTLWRERIEYIDEVLEPVIGKAKSGEDVLKAVEGMMRGTNGGAARLRGVMKELPPEQAGNVRATIIDRLGKATAGAQDDVGSVFSSSTFLTNWNNMTPQAKAVLFSEDKLRANLDDIAKIANATKQAQRFANHSNTAGGLVGNVGGIVGIGYASPSLAATALTSQYLTGKLLASPRFTAWLARAPKNPNAQLRYVEQLGIIASKEPAIAGDARAIQQFLTERLAGSPSRAAASEQDENGGPKPPQ
jgi:hypothetical protein